MTVFDQMIAFANARLDEDEAAANRAIKASGLREPWQADHWNEMHPADAAHFNGWSPTRVLRAVAVKRVILALCASETDETGGRALALRVVHQVITEWDDHPDYPMKATATERRRLES
jgi:hypothetical protein